MDPNRARDYYDLWRMLGSHRGNLDLTDFRDRLNEKCTLRGVDFQGPKDFFDQRTVADVERGREQSLGSLMPGFPVIGAVINELRPQQTSAELVG